jgi:glycosyltransferase involved in cell wall biosynthesis
MRILFVTHYALPHIGGIETPIDAVAAGLTARGHSVTHVASAALRPAERGSPVPPRPYRRVLVPAMNWPEERLGAPYPLFSPRLGRVLRRELAAADVVHCHGFLYMGTIAALALRRDRPAVLTEHVGHVDYANPVLDAAQAAAIASIGRWCARRADALVVYNDKVREELAALAPGARIEWIGNGVDPGRFSPARDGAERQRLRDELGWDGRPRALFVGRRVAKKGLGKALATAAAGEGRFRLAIAGTDRLPGGASGGGSGPASGGSAPEHVDLLGHVDPDRMPDLYRAADAMLLPSHGEGFPVAVQEAMASGLPVVLAEDPAYREHLRGAAPGAAELVAPEPAALAAAVSALVADPERRAAAGAAAAEHARSSFSFERVLDEHERLYTSLTGSDPVSARGGQTP